MYYSFHFMPIDFLNETHWPFKDKLQTRRHRQEFLLHTDHFNTFVKENTEKFST